MITPPPIEYASLGMWDTMILAVMALVVFGPRRLPEIGRQIGKLMYEVRKASNDFKFQMEDELRKSDDAERRMKEAAYSRDQGSGIRDQVPALTINGDSPVPELGAGVPENSQVPDDPYAQIEAYPPSTGEPVPANATAEANPTQEPASHD